MRYLISGCIRLMKKIRPYRCEKKPWEKIILPQLYRKPTATPIDARDYPQSTAIRIGSPSRAPARGQYGPNGPTQEELEEEKEEPDRLSLLLPQSRFDCVNKQTGYYADEDLNCEVFHYCQDNAKHSWICPEGFTFHQVSKSTYVLLYLIFY